MILINSIKVDELIEQLKLFNSNLEKMNFNKQEEIFYTRKEAKEPVSYTHLRAHET